MCEADAKQVANKPSTSLSLAGTSHHPNLPKLQPLGLLDRLRRWISFAVGVHDGVRLKKGGRKRAELVLQQQDDHHPRGPRLQRYTC